MKATTVILLTVAGIILYNLIRGVSSLKQIKFLPGGVSNIGFSGLTPVMNFTLLAQNTGVIPVTVNSFAGSLSQVTAQGLVNIANISSFTSTSVPANSQTPITFSASLSLIGAVSDIISSFNSGNFSQTLNLSGNANIDNYSLPVNVNFQL